MIIKRVLAAMALLAPALLLLFFTLQPQADRVAIWPLFHFYIVTFTSFAAAVISILLVLLLEDVASPRHVLISVAFAAIGTIFFSHGLATPEAIIDHFHPAVRWSAWLTLLSGGLLFMLATISSSRLSTRRVVYVTVASIVGYFAFALWAPQWLTLMDERSQSWQSMIIFFSTLMLWLIAAWRFFSIWRVSRNQVDGVLAVVSFWIAQAAISQHHFPTWQLSWWLYHFILLACFLFTLYILAVEYEQARRFSVLWYFLGLSLMLTALLALLASHLFALHSYQTLLSKVESSTIAAASSLAGTLTRELPRNATPTEIATLALTLPSSEAMISIYEPNGTILYGKMAGMAEAMPKDVLEFRRALVGERAVKTYPPNISLPSGYTSAEPIHMVTTYVPVGREASPLAVLVTTQSAPELNQGIMSARATGLTISALTMGLLFTALLLVVRRADKIIVSRTNELNRAKRQSDELLLNVLPASIAQELKEKGKVTPVHYESVTVMFTDFKKFTRIAATLTPEELVSTLDLCFSYFDQVSSQFHLEKLKTIGDSYMCAAGIPVPNQTHAKDVVQAALKIQAFMEQKKAQKLTANEPYWEIRIGIHSGPLVAGVIGEKKFAYDVWGDTVNTASRMESASEAGQINIS